MEKSWATTTNEAAWQRQQSSSAEEPAGSRTTGFCFVQDPPVWEKFYFNILVPYSSAGLAIAAVMKMKSQSC